eukprot:1933615-Prymnesium_polylepis.1
MPKSPAVAVEGQHVIASRRAAARAPAPAAATAAPAYCSLALRAASPARPHKLPRAPRSQLP